MKFQQYDDYPIATDGFVIDDISVTVAGGGGGGFYRLDAPGFRETKKMVLLQ